MENRARGQNAKDVNVDALARAVAASAAKSPDRGSPRTIRVESEKRVRMRVDPEQVETILANLVSNALKYSPDGSDVTITVREEPGWVAVDVTDHSEGIPGTGLGLHLSRGLAQALGGDIQVTSRPREGSTFTLRLPRGRNGPAGRIHA